MRHTADDGCCCMMRCHGIVSLGTCRTRTLTLVKSTLRLVCTRRICFSNNDDDDEASSHSVRVDAAASNERKEKVCQFVTTFPVHSASQNYFVFLIFFSLKTKSRYYTSA